MKEALGVQVAHALGYLYGHVDYPVEVLLGRVRRRVDVQVLVQGGAATHAHDDRQLGWLQTRAHKQYEIRVPRLGQIGHFLFELFELLARFA